MNEEGRLRNIISELPTGAPAAPPSTSDSAFVAAPLPAPRWKSKSSKSTTSSKVVRCFKCGGVGHIRPKCPTPDEDAIDLAALAIDDEEDQTFTAIADEEVEEAW
jgi:hypothetical protein